MKETLRICYKKTYDSPLACIEGAERYRKMYDNVKVELYFYHCPNCGKYHLTQSEKHRTSGTRNQIARRS